MAYNNGFYPPYFQSNIPQQPSMPAPQMQVQNGGFISATNEDFARNYPVALGTSIVFKDETAPYIYTKTMGFSQLDTPKFEKYRLVKEAAESPHREAETEKPNTSILDELKSEIEAIKADVEGLKNKVYAPTISVSKKKKEVIVDDATDE